MPERIPSWQSLVNYHNIFNFHLNGDVMSNQLFSWNDQTYSAFAKHFSFEVSPEPV